ncbi:MAG: M14 family zinc carboxypeptidase [Armatimonadota bacterium]
MRFCTWLSIIILSYLVTVSAFALTGATTQPKAPAAPPPIAIIPGDGMNLKIIEQPTPDTLIVAPDPPVHNWWAGTLTNVPIDREISIGITMAGMDTAGNKADVRKWQGLRPVMTYADPERYETYEWFTKDEQGRWVSGDPLKKGDARFAGSGTIPVQSVIPRSLAGQFLSKGGRYWQAWREVDHAEAISNRNLFRIKQKFAEPSATVALRIPFTYTLLQQFVDKCVSINTPGLFIDEIGFTAEGRKIQIIRVDDIQKPININALSERLPYDYSMFYKFEIDNHVAYKNRNIFLLIGREHANEHISSWVIYGTLAALMNEKNRPNRINKTWLLIFIEDVDGSYNSTFDQLTGHFKKHENDNIYGNYTPIEILEYIYYLREFVNSDIPIDVSISFHGLECNEGQNILCPFIISWQSNYAISFNQLLFERLRENGFETGPAKIIEQGNIWNRLYAFCANRYRSLGLAFEVNDRYPACRLNLMETQSIGYYIPKSLLDFTDTDMYKEYLTLQSSFLSQRTAERRRHYQSIVNGSNQGQPSLYELLTLGY